MTHHLAGSILKIIIYTLKIVHILHKGAWLFILKKNIKVKKIPVPKNINHPELICLELEIKNTKIAVVCVYKSPRLSYTTFGNIVEFLADINSKMKTLSPWGTSIFAN